MKQAETNHTVALILEEIGIRIAVEHDVAVLFRRALVESSRSAHSE